MDRATAQPGELYKLSLDCYHRIIELGILGEDDPGVGSGPR